MRIMMFLLQKEFKQIFRDKSLLPLIFILPIIQLLILPLAADYEVKNINISIVDHDHSSFSRELTNKVVASGYFILTEYSGSFDAAFTQIEKNTADLILEIPQDFERDLIREQKHQMFFAVNAINGVKANLGGAYLARIIQDYNTDLRKELIGAANMNIATNIEVQSSNWFNALLNYNFFMVPGILVLLVTMVASYMCALNIVKEKEIGTIEQINVTPIKKWQFILGKLIPFWVIGIFVFTVGLFLIGGVVYGIKPQGSILLLYSYLSLYLIAILGLGLLISTYSQTQQQAMSVAFFFVMIFLLMSGLFTSVDSMPEWSKMIAYANPVTYFMEVVRMIVLKGSQFADISKHFLITLCFAIFFNTWAILNYRKTS
jgi:ABC-2 type transport system permease protein